MKKYWISFSIVIVVSFAGLIYLGSEIYQVAPPIPERVITTDGEVVFTGAANKIWKNCVIRFAFRSINIGLVLMVFISGLLVGIAQTIASVEHGLWYARSAEFLQSPTLDTSDV